MGTREKKWRNPFLCSTTNQFPQNFKFLANLIKYFVNICNVYNLFSKSVKWSDTTVSIGPVRKGEKKTINRS